MNFEDLSYGAYNVSEYREIMQRNFNITQAGKASTWSAIEKHNRKVVILK